MDLFSHLLVFTVGEGRYGIPITNVERIIRTVDIVSLAGAPGVILGIINLAGKIIPVADPRRRFGFPERTLALEDRLIICRTEKRSLALLVEQVHGLITPTPDAFSPLNVKDMDSEYIQGVVKLQDSLLLIHDLEAFLSLDEERQLTEALSTPDAENNES